MTDENSLDEWPAGTADDPAAQGRTDEGAGALAGALQRLQLQLSHPEVAKAYGLERSRYNAIINIAVQDKQKVAQAVGITGEAKNLTGTIRTLSFQEVKEGDAIYYLATLPYRNEDTYQFTLKIMGGGQQQNLSFQQTFYVD